MGCESIKIGLGCFRTAYVLSFPDKGQFIRATYWRVAKFMLTDKEIKDYLIEIWKLAQATQPKKKPVEYKQPEHNQVFDEPIEKKPRRRKATEKKE